MFALERKFSHMGKAKLAHLEPGLSFVGKLWFGIVL
jgi:hypothetical protein